MAFLAKINSGAIAIVIGVLLLWQLVVVTGLVRLNYFPAPTEVGVALIESATTGRLFGSIAYTLGIALLAGAIAIVLGTLIGVALGLLPWLRTYSLGSIDVFRSLPVVALMPLALLIWGPGMLAELVLAVYGALWLMIVNTFGGVRGIHPRLIEVASTFQLSTLDRVRKIVVPASAPSILVGARLAIVTALIVTITAEMFVHPEGLGWRLVEAQQGLRPDAMWAYALVCGVLGYLLNLALVRGVGVLIPGGHASFAGVGKP